MRMIETNTYTRIILQLDGDIRFIDRNLIKYEKVLKNIFGTKTYVKIREKIHGIEDNIKVLKQDLKKQEII